MPGRTTWRTITRWCTAVALTLTTVAALAQAQTGWTGSQQAKRIDQYGRLDAAAAMHAVSVQDDDMEAVATLSTEPVFHFRGGFTDRLRADTFIRALIDKQTRQTTYQVYEHLTYSGDDREFTSANVETPSGLTTLHLDVLGNKLSCPDGTCIRKEDIAFTVPRSLLQEIAARSAERPVRPWRFRLKAASGLDWTDDIAPAEIAGLLASVDAWLAGHPAR